MQLENTESATAPKTLVEKLLQSGFIDRIALNALAEPSRAELSRQSHKRQLLALLVGFKLVTCYQSERILAGTVDGLILGDYRVLDRLGGGNDGVVFRGEHRQTGQQVAIKVLIPTPGQGPKAMVRFFAERTTVAQLSHPNIVRALDFGETASTDPRKPVLYYYAMEHIQGLDLEKHVNQNGPMQTSLACETAYQVADALTEAHKHDLVHRDVKPANVVLTPEGRAMLLDFGLVRQFRSRQTEAGSLVGILEWIAPEQLRDAHGVDIRADIYSLGCTLFWCLTGQSPHGVRPSLRSSQAEFDEPEKPRLPRVDDFRHDIAPELNVVVARMMAPQPNHRYSNPQAVMAALSPFVSERYALAANISPPVAEIASSPVDASIEDRLTKPSPAPAGFWQSKVNWLLGHKK